MENIIWLAGVSQDPTNPFEADLFATTSRQVDFAWLVGSLVEYGEAAEPFIMDATKALADPNPEQGFLMGFLDEDSGSEVRAFAMPITLIGDVTVVAVPVSAN